jgi:hypothetical protein
MGVSQNTSAKAKINFEAKTPEELDYIMTAGDVMITGGHLVGDKMCALACEILKMYPYCGVTNVVFKSDNYPVDIKGDAIFGATYADTNSVSINLQRIWKEAVDTTEAGDVALGFMGVLWMNLINQLGHELTHLMQASADRDAYEIMRLTDDGQEELEREAKASADALILDLAVKFDIEPPAIEAMGWFGIKFMEMFTGPEKDDNWVVGARCMIADGVIYNNGKEVCNTFRDFVHRAYDEEHVHDWTQTVSAVNIDVLNTDGDVVETLAAVPVQAPVIDVKEIVEEVTTEIVKDTVAFLTEDDEGTGIVVEDGLDYDDEELAAQAEAHTPAEIAIEMTTPKAEWTEVANSSTPESSGLEDHSGMVYDNAQAIVEANKVVVDENGVIEAEFVVETPPLADSTIAQKKVYSDAAATADAKLATDHTETPFTPTNLAPDKQAACMKAIYQTMYHHIFTKCGWQQDVATGRFHFAKPSAVMEGVDISRLIAHFGADGFIQEMDTHNAEGQYASEKFNGIIRGRLTSKQGIPSYDIYLNLGGHRFKRSFVAQNPEAKKWNGNGEYSGPADEAGLEGKKIAWVFKGEADNKAKFMEKVSVIIKENAYQVVVGGKVQE